MRLQRVPPMVKVPELNCAYICGNEDLVTLAEKAVKDFHKANEFPKDWNQKCHVRFVGLSHLPIMGRYFALHALFTVTSLGEEA